MGGPPFQIMTYHGGGGRHLRVPAMNDTPEIRIIDLDGLPLPQGAEEAMAYAFHDVGWRHTLAAENRARKRQSVIETADQAAREAKRAEILNRRKAIQDQDSR